MKFIDFRKKLENEVVSFKYTKKDGTIREAKGTTNPGIIEKNYDHTYLPKGEKDIKYSEDVTRYFDVEKIGWRSFQNKSFIED